MLLTSKEVKAELHEYFTDGTVISDECAATIASWWQSPSKRDESLLMVAQGNQMDTHELRDARLRVMELMWTEQVLTAGDERAENLRTLTALVEWLAETDRMQP
jgi:threonine dehydratase